MARDPLVGRRRDVGKENSEIDASPYPSALPVEEIKRLRRQLIDTNRKLAKLWAKSSLDRKAASVLIQKLRTGKAK